MIRRSLVSVLGLLALCVVVGCFKSSTTQASSESSSKASSSPFESSSASSSPSDDEGEDSAYRRDVRDYAARFATGGGDVQAFQRDLGAIAEGHGVTDWEREQATYVAIGQGLARAGLDQSQFHRLAVQIAHEDHAHLALLRAGYERTPQP